MAFQHKRMCNYLDLIYNTIQYVKIIYGILLFDNIVTTVISI